MSAFGASVEYTMTAPVLAVEAGDPLVAARDLLDDHPISALAVTSDAGRLVGVISRTDLLRLGRHEPERGRSLTALRFPDATVGEVMTKDPLTATRETRLASAAKTMVKHRIHRVFVVDDGVAVGVVSTKEVLRAVREERVRTPIRELMSPSLYTIQVDEPLEVALERLESARVTGLVVVERDWPVGTFGQLEALEARDLPGDVQVDDVMSPAILCLRSDTALHRAATQAAMMDARRVIVLEDDRAVGIVTGLDMARAASFGAPEARGR